MHFLTSSRLEVSSHGSCLCLLPPSPPPFSLISSVGYLCIFVLPFSLEWCLYINIYINIFCMFVSTFCIFFSGFFLMFWLQNVHVNHWAKRTLPHSHAPSTKYIYQWVSTTENREIKETSKTKKSYCRCDFYVAEVFFVTFVIIKGPNHHESS